MSQRKTPGQTPTIPGRTPKRPAPTDSGPIIGKRMPDKRTPIPTPKRPAPKGGPVVNKTPDKRVPPQSKTTGNALKSAALERAVSKVKAKAASNRNAGVSKQATVLAARRRAKRGGE